MEFYNYTFSEEMSYILTDLRAELQASVDSAITVVNSLDSSAVALHYNTIQGYLDKLISFTDKSTLPLFVKPTSNATAERILDGKGVEVLAGRVFLAGSDDNLSALRLLYQRTDIDTLQDFLKLSPGSCTWIAIQNNNIIWIEPNIADVIDLIYRNVVPTVASVNELVIEIFWLVTINSSLVKIKQLQAKGFANDNLQAAISEITSHYMVRSYKIPDKLLLTNMGISDANIEELLGQRIITKIDPDYPETITELLAPLQTMLDDSPVLGKEIAGYPQYLSLAALLLHIFDVRQFGLLIDYYSLVDAVEESGNAVAALAIINDIYTMLNRLISSVKTAIYSFFYDSGYFLTYLLGVTRGDNFSDSMLGQVNRMFMPGSAATASITITAPAQQGNPLTDQPFADKIDSTIITIKDMAGKSVTYTWNNTDPLILVRPIPAVSIFGDVAASTIASRLQTAIEDINGHNGTILVSRTNNVLTLTQATLGSSGNTTINTTTSSTYLMVTNFTGGTGPTSLEDLTNYFQTSGYSFDLSSLGRNVIQKLNKVQASILVFKQTIEEIILLTKGTPQSLDIADSISGASTLLSFIENLIIRLIADANTLVSTTDSNLLNMGITLTTAQTTSSGSALAALRKQK